MLYACKSLKMSGSVNMQVYNTSRLRNTVTGLWHVELQYPFFFKYCCICFFFRFIFTIAQHKLMIIIANKSGGKKYTMKQKDCG